MPEEKMEATKEEIEEAKSLVWLSYLGILFLIPMLVQKDNKFSRFHSKQGMVLFFYEVGWFIVIALLTALSLFLAYTIRGLGMVCTSIISMISLLGWILWLVISIIGIVQSLRKKWWRCPFGIGALAEKIKF